MINLTDEEYRKFSTWCRQEADSYEGITAQMEKMPGPEVVLKHHRARMHALRIVAQMMEKTERETAREKELSPLQQYPGGRNLRGVGLGARPSAGDESAPDPAGEPQTPTGNVPDPAKVAGPQSIREKP